MEKSKLPYLIIMLILLPIQLLYIKLVQEPYPAILGPGFGTLKQEKRNVVLFNYKVCIKRKGQCIKEISLDCILPTVPNHARFAAIETFVDLMDDEAKNEEVKLFLKQQVEGMFELHQNDSITLLKVKSYSDLHNGRSESVHLKELFSLNLSK